MDGRGNRVCVGDHGGDAACCLATTRLKTSHWAQSGATDTPPSKARRPVTMIYNFTILVVFRATCGCH